MNKINPGPIKGNFAKMSGWSNEEIFSNLLHSAYCRIIIIYSHGLQSFEKGTYCK